MTEAGSKPLGEFSAASRPEPEPGIERDLLNRLGAVVFRTDAAGNWTYLNPTWATITGFSVEETLGSNFLEYVHPEERDHTVALFMAVMEGSASACHHETRYRTKAGGYRWLELRATLLYDDAGELVGNCGTLTDITARRQTEHAIDERVQLTELVASGESFDDLPYGALLLDKDFIVRRASATARRLLGEELAAGTRLADLLSRFEIRDPRGAVLSGQWGPLGTAVSTGQSQYGELRVRRHDHDSALWLQTTVIPSPHHDDSSGELVVLLQDVTELRSAEIRQATVARLGQRALDAATLQELLEDALESVVDVLGTDWAELFVMGPYGQLDLRAQTSRPDGAAEPKPEVSEALLHLAERAERTGRPLHSREIALRHAGRPIAVSSLSVPVQVAHPHLVMQTHSLRERAFRTEEITFVQVMAGVLASATQRREMEDAALARSLHDPLTGLANRALLRDRLDQALRNGRESNRGFALLALDLDGFKRINDTLGHGAGDDVLRSVSERLIRATRDSDTVARVGGDEFIVLLPGLCTYEDASRVTAHLHASVAQPILLGDTAVDVHASIGAAISTQPVDEPAELLKRADVAMYEAKRARCGYVVHRIGEERPPARVPLPRT